MRSLLMLAGAALLALAVSSPAQAHHYRHHYRHHHYAHRYHYRHHRHYARLDANGNVVGGRPSGCPHAYCGCAASLKIFGRIVKSLNLAANWLRKFPHVPKSMAQPGMAAARAHHVFVIDGFCSGGRVLAYDGNSGHGLTREHCRSLAGFTVVNPRG
jgi:hypothetical protein